MGTHGLAHVAVCVPDLDAAVAWYVEALGLRLLSPPYRMEGEAISRDMGPLLCNQPAVLYAAILGFDKGDHVLELIEYPNEPKDTDASRPVSQPGLTHIGIVCHDIDATRAELEAAGATFLVPATAAIAGLRTTWFRDPWGVTFILMEKGDDEKPYWRQP